MKRKLNSQISAKRILDVFRNLCMEAYMILIEVPTTTHQFYSLHKWILLPILLRLILLFVMEYKSITYSLTVSKSDCLTKIPLNQRNVCKIAILHFDGFL